MNIRTKRASKLGLCNFLPRNIKANISTKQLLGKSYIYPSSSPLSPLFYPQQTCQNRLLEHYRTTLCQDILTLTYTHETDEKLKKTDAIRYWDNSSPYHKNRPSRPLKGNKPIRPAQEPRTHRNIPILEATIVHSMIKDAINNKTALLSMVMALHCITGLKPEIINARTGVAPWKLRTGMPIATKVTLKGAEMYRFLTVLIELVIPRMRDMVSGFKADSGDSTGNICLGFSPDALSLFPEIQANYDMFPNITGFHVHFNTTAKSDQECRLLLSGFGIPFKTQNKI
ncbi:mitochondrial 54S ribosomal protein YmL7/YmL5 [Pneumocystis jirovecii RU7]|uniref:Uncharacterized protein n=1 Tax=Pneumocystis jirovecii (strain RU7) TaxID=1408657 RepID=A0A0W4ZTI3_PNEJ7|nr:mitochondrial 54S ribosomal protein YmL7/YmL5 [Pneumocystis jirovecii RU7]KTW31698.1 hypothetical protein T551_00959 [Pneumocystis jirovecii RU7]